MNCTVEIAPTQAAARIRRDFWEAKGANYTVTLTEVGVFTVYDYRITAPQPPQLLANGVPTPPATTVWLVQVLIA